ncbi:hypothetical protein KK062_30025, partial [Fulvivirgaceae bacterium PWU5]
MASVPVAGKSGASVSAKRVSCDYPYGRSPDWREAFLPDSLTLQQCYTLARQHAPQAQQQALLQ